MASAARAVLGASLLAVGVLLYWWVGLPPMRACHVLEWAYGAVFGSPFPSLCRAYSDTGLALNPAETFDAIQRSVRWVALVSLALGGALAIRNRAAFGA